MNKPHRRFVRYARGKNAMQQNLNQHQCNAHNGSDKFLNNLNASSSEYLTHAAVLENSDNAPDQPAIAAADDIEVIKAEPQRVENCCQQQQQQQQRFTPPQPQRAWRAPHNHQQQQPLQQQQHQQQQQQHQLHCNHQPHPPTQPPQQYWRQKCTTNTIQNSTQTTTEKQVSPSSLNKNRKVSGVFSDTAICLNQNTRNLLDSIESLTKNLEQIIAKLKSNELLSADNERTAILVCAACERTATVNRDLQLLQNETQQHTERKQSYKQMIVDEPINHAGDSYERTSFDKYPRHAPCVNCGVCSRSVQCVAAGVQQQQQTTAKRHNNISNSNSSQMMEPNYISSNEHIPTRAKYGKMITRATTMHNDILQISNVCIGYRLTLPVHLIQYMAMIFICVSYWLQKNNGIVVYFLVIGLIAITVHLLSRNVYYYAPNHFNVVNETRF